MRYIMLVLMSLSLTACFGSAPEKHRYQLPITETDTMLYEVSRPVIQLHPVELSEMLYQPGIILQTDDITLNVARQHVWSSDLQQQITLGLQRRLQQRLPDYTVLLSVSADQLGRSQSLLMRIDAFQGHYDGYALTEGQWQLHGADKVLVFHGSVKLKTPLAEDGYGALVRALGNNLDTLADNIAHALKS